MKWSWKLATVAGIGLYVHATFLLFCAWVWVLYWLAGGSAAALSGIGFILALFACVILHELGHALTARRYGIRTRDITLLPIGGVSRLERIPDDPRQEVWVSLAGPAVNVVIAAALYAWLLLSQTLRPFSALTMAGGPFLERLLLVNVSLAVFNLLPAFPMDGGRVLRAVLAMRMDYVRATQVSAQVGQAMALAFGLLGLFTNPFLVFIAFFVWIGAAQEASMVQMRTALSGIPVSRAMLTDFHTVAPDDTAKRVLEHITAQQHARKAAHLSRLALVDHWEVLLGSREDQLKHSFRGVIRRHGVEVGEHSATHRNTAQGGAHLHHARLLGRADPDEERDEHEERVRKQTEQAEPEGHRLPDLRGDLRGPDVVHAHGQHSPQHPTAVHGEGGEQVEDREGNVHEQQSLEERTTGHGERGERAQGLREEEPGVECRRDDHIHGGARQRHPNLLTRIFRYAL